MSIAETVLIFAGIPLAVAAIVTVLVYSGGRRRLRRYRPGRPYEFDPVWFVAGPDRIGDAAAAGTRRTAIRGGHAPVPALPGVEPGTAQWPKERPQGETGGASDRW